jgi:dolichyl-phosphate-mannose-protein mannosyltransferase
MDATYDIASVTNGAHISTLEQQLTLYPHKDDNNWWRLTKQYGENPTEIEWVQNGDIVRVEHVSTNKRLHSHDVRPPMTDVEYHNEVR